MNEWGLGKCWNDIVSLHIFVGRLGRNHVSAIFRSTIVAKTLCVSNLRDDDLGSHACVRRYRRLFTDVDGEVIEWEGEERDMHRPLCVKSLSITK